MTSTFMEELKNRGLSVVSDLAARSVDPILLNDMFALHRLLNETITNHPDAAYAFVQDDTGQVIAHTFGDAGFAPDRWSRPWKTARNLSLTAISNTWCTKATTVRSTNSLP